MGRRLTFSEDDCKIMRLVGLGDIAPPRRGGSLQLSKMEVVLNRLSVREEFEDRADDDDVLIAWR